MQVLKINECECKRRTVTSYLYMSMHLPFFWQDVRLSPTTLRQSLTTTGTCKFHNYVIMMSSFWLCQPSTLVSPTTVLKCQKGNCFDFSVLLCSLLIGAGYDAYCVCGYATRETTLMDETREICPLLRKKDEVS